MPKPYVSITDFMDADFVREMLAVFRETRLVHTHQLGVGVMMSYKTMNGLPTKWKDAFPPTEKIAQIFVDDPLAFNTLHYADYEGVSVHLSLLRAIAFGGPHLRALQLDMVWPAPDAVAAVKMAHPDLEIILQVGRKSLELCNENPLRMVDKIAAYNNALSYILLDKSGGEGRGLNATELLRYASAIREHFPRLMIVVAGGLGPVTMHLIDSLVREIPDLSWCAQSKLRPTGSALDPLHPDLCATYLRVSSHVGRT